MGVETETTTISTYRGENEKRQLTELRELEAFEQSNLQ